MIYSGKVLAVIGCSPSGLDAAEDFIRSGHLVRVFDKKRGIPGLGRRVSLLEKEGVRFIFGAEIGKDVPAPFLLKSYDAVLLSIGSSPTPSDMIINGSDADGVFRQISELNDYLQSRGQGGGVPGVVAAPTNAVGPLAVMAQTPLVTATPNGGIVTAPTQSNNAVAPTTIPTAAATPSAPAASAPPVVSRRHARAAVAAPPPLPPRKRQAQGFYKDDDPTDFDTTLNAGIQARKEEKREKSDKTVKQRRNIQKHTTKK